MMTTLTYYRQKRADGGIRWGIELDGTTIDSHFTEGSSDRDPVLLWYVDIRCEGRSLPHEEVQAILWLGDHADVIQKAIEMAAKQFVVGMDADEWPVRIPMKGLPKGVRGTIICSAVRRVTGRELAKVLTSLANNWTRSIRRVTSSKEVYA
jgi:hypothetical protein